MKVSKLVSMLSCAAIVMCLSVSANAATMSVSGSAPTVDGADISQLLGTTDQGGNDGHVWSNRPIQGQTFTTGSNAGGYNLNAVTMRTRVDQNSTTSAWTVRVGAIGGTNFSVLTSEAATGVAIPNGNPGAWATWTFDAPVMLDANTLYAFDVDSAGGGFISMNSADNVGPYADGTAYRSGSGGNPANPITTLNFDRAFHVDIEAKGGGVPEPATATLALLSMAGLIARRRRA